MGNNKLFISNLDRCYYLIKMKHAGYQRVSRRSTCSARKSGTLDIEITNARFECFFWRSGFFHYPLKHQQILRIQAIA